MRRRKAGFIEATGKHSESICDFATDLVFGQNIWVPAHGIELGGLSSETFLDVGREVQQKSIYTSFHVGRLMVVPPLWEVSG